LSWLLYTKQSQLNLQMVHGKTFPYYNEAIITFLPTYKYDVGTDEYDSSDKARIPAWCDRVLTKGHNLRQIHYDTAPLKFSVIDEKKKQEISEGLYKHRRAVVGGHTANADANSDDEDLLGYESIEPGLPPASSDRRKWWLDNGTAARSKVKPPGDGYVRNPQRAPNPFSATTEPDWVKVPRPNPPPPRSLSVRERKTSTATAPLSENLERKAIAGSRKLPPVWPAHQAAAAPTSRASSTQQTLLDDPISEPQPPRLPRRPSVSSQHSITRKPAPPIPKKPTMLRSESSTSTRDDGFVPKLPSRVSTLPVQQQQSPVAKSVIMPMLAAPPPSRRSLVEVNARGIESWSRQTSGAQSMQSAQSKQSDNGPPLPPRRGTGLSQAQGQGQKNLLDDEEDGMAGWKPLRPN
jgi:hypothetical protein